MSEAPFDEANATSEQLIYHFAKCWTATPPRKAEADRAFQLLYDRHRRGLRGFIQTEIEGSAPFIMQEGKQISVDVWREIARSAAGFQGKARFFSWACAIAHNKLWDRIMAVRKAKSIQAPSDEEGRQPILDAIPGREAPVAKLAETNELARDMDAALAKVDPTLRMVFLMRTRDDLGWSEINKITGIPMSTLQDYKDRAVALLRPLLKSHDPSTRTGEHHDA
jgi:RNA polymerase sigma factor (sigma-70 family)